LAKAKSFRPGYETQIALTKKLFRKSAPIDKMKAALAAAASA
jgi:hypothetical protein